MLTLPQLLSFAVIALMMAAFVWGRLRYDLVAVLALLAALAVGVVPLEEKATGITFGGKDMKSLYITTEGVKVWELRVNVPGISQ